MQHGGCEKQIIVCNPETHLHLVGGAVMLSKQKLEGRRPVCPARSAPVPSVIK